MGAEDQAKILKAGGTNDDQAAIRKFVQAGKKPIYMGWGCCTGMDPEHVIKLAIGTAEASKQRVIILKGWANLSMALLERVCSDKKHLIDYARENVLFVEQDAHDWLFSLCAAVVHQGGMVAIGAAWKAGTPSIVTPVWCDHFDNASVVAATKTGVATPPLEKCTVQDVVVAIDHVSTAKLITRKCQSIKASVCREDAMTMVLKHVSKFIDEVDSGRWMAHIRSGESVI